MERVGSADMGRRVRQNGRNQTSLVLRRDRSVAPLPKGKIDNSFVDNHVAHPGEDQPFREESRAEMDGGHTRPRSSLRRLAAKRRTAGARPSPNTPSTASTPPPERGRCYPCVRYDLSPMSRAAHDANLTSVSLRDRDRSTRSSSSPVV